MNVLKFIRENVFADQISKNRAGNIIFRKGYYYRHGQDAQSFANNIENQLKNLNIDAVLVEYHDIFKPFRGGASLAQSSHFYAEFKLI